MISSLSSLVRRGPLGSAELSNLSRYDSTVNIFAHLGTARNSVSTPFAVSEERRQQQWWGRPDALFAGMVRDA
jgi:hypothetical protein